MLPAKPDTSERAAFVPPHITTLGVEIMAKKPGRASEPASRANVNDDIGEEMRLRMYEMQVLLRESEQRAFDLFLQTLFKGTSHLPLGQDAVAPRFPPAIAPKHLTFYTFPP